MKRILSLLLILIAGNSGFSQIVFEKMFISGSGSKANQALALNDGYLVTGNILASAGTNSGVFIMKTNINGDTVWTRKLESAENIYSNAVCKATAHGYLLAGYSENGPGGNTDVMLIRIDSAGTVMWTRTFGGAGNEKGNSIEQTTDGGFIIAGQTTAPDGENSDIYIIKGDSDGNPEWERTAGSSLYQNAFNAKETPDGGYIVTGETGNAATDSLDVLLAKFDGNGNLLWSKSYGGNANDNGRSVVITPDEGYMIAGSSTSYGAGNSDMYLIKTDSSGNEAWSEVFGGLGNDSGNSLNMLSSGDYIISGGTSSFGSAENVFLVKINDNGNPFWTRALGSTTSCTANSVCTTSDGGYFIAGNSGLYGYMLKTNDAGQTTCSNKMIPAVYSFVSSVVQPLSMAGGPSAINMSYAALAEEQGLNVFTRCYDNQSLSTVSLTINNVVPDEDTTVYNAEDASMRNTQYTTDQSSGIGDAFSFTVYPNPGNGESINIQMAAKSSGEILVIVYDLMGRTNYSKIFISSENGSTVFAADPSEKLSPGIYMITASSGNSKCTKKLVVR